MDFSFLFWGSTRSGSTARSLACLMTSRGNKARMASFVVMSLAGFEGF